MNAEDKKLMTELLQAEAGAELADALGMKRRRDNDRWDTTWGDKTDLGFFLTVKRFIAMRERDIESQLEKENVTAG